MLPITHNRTPIWYAAGPVGKVLTTNFVATDAFYVSVENDLLFTVTLGGLAPTSLILQLEESQDGSTNWTVFPLAGVLDGSIAQQGYIVTILPKLYYRMSAKRVGGDGTTTALIYGSTRDINSDIIEYSTITTLGTIIQGNVAHDDPDTGNPVKIGGKASTAGAVAVANGDRVNADFTLEGLQRIDADVTKVAGTAIVEAGVSGLQAVGGNVAHDGVDAGNPVKVAGVYRSTPPTVVDGDRADLFMDAAGRAQIRAQGEVAHDAVDAGDPIKTGGKASTAGAVAVANGDRVNADFTLEGLQRIDADVTKVAGTAIVEGGVSGLLAFAGNVAHDGVDAGNPIKTGGKASTSEPAAVANADRVDAYYDENGYQRVKPVGTVADDAASDATAPLKIGAIAYGAISAVSDSDMVSLITDLYRRLRTVDAAYDSLQDANAIVSRNGPETKNDYETLAEVTNGANGTYKYYVDMTGFRKLAIQLELTGTLTVTIEGAIQADGTVPASCTYQDITEDTFGDASYTATDMLIDNAEKLAGQHYVDIKVVAAGGGTDDWTIYIKKLY